MVKKLGFILFFVFLNVESCIAQGLGLGVGRDPFSNENVDDVEQLIRDAEELMLLKQPIDARAKLQKALQLRPNEYRIHLLLGQYYLSEVGHFTLAYRYIRHAEKLFLEKFARGDGSVPSDELRPYVILLYLRSEAELNLDKYKDSLTTLDRIEKMYPPEQLGWYMASRAWVLMKLKRIDEAIETAQTGVMIDSDSKRIYNILGILLSVSGKRELSLKAFARAIATEMQYGSIGQAATPLNNAGEVYRELFQDHLAEASWIKALSMPDGCDHVLPSLNSSILYIDQLRLLQANRVLKDFEVCYAAQSSRQDTEHRALLSLSRGRIALHSGEFDEALKLLGDASEREQWFGKIGTNENDVRLASTIGMSNVLFAKAVTLKDMVRDKRLDRLKDLTQIPQLKIRSWWLARQARRMAVEELDDFEDLYIRHTDTMIEYPTLGSILQGYPTVSLERRLNRLLKTDARERAHDQYRLYLAANYLAHGKTEKAIEILRYLRGTLRAIDRLAKAQVLALLIQAVEKDRSWWSGPTVQERSESLKLREELFQLQPARIRSADLALPVRSRIVSIDRAGSYRLERARKRLEIRFPEVDSDLKNDCIYELRLRETGNTGGASSVSIELVRLADESLLMNESGTLSNREGYELLLNKFIAATFRHKLDPPGEPVPELELLEGIL